VDSDMEFHRDVLFFATTLSTLSLSSATYGTDIVSYKRRPV